jgi:hypothetical protein
MDAYFQWLREKHLAESLALAPPMLGPAPLRGPDPPAYLGLPPPLHEEEHRSFWRAPFSYLTVLGQSALGRPWQLYCGLAF